MGGWGIWELSVLSNQLCCESKAALKNSLLIKKNKNKKENSLPSRYFEYTVKR